MNTGDPKFLTGEVITAARLGKRDDAITGALPKDGSEAMTSKLTTPAVDVAGQMQAGSVKIAGAAPVLIMADTDAGQVWGVLRVDSGFLYVDQYTSAGALNATRVKIDLLTGSVYTGAALDQRLATEKMAIAMAIALGG